MNNAEMQQKATVLSNQFRTLAQYFREVDLAGGYQRVIDLAGNGAKLCKKAYDTGLLELTGYTRQVTMLTEWASSPPQEDLPSWIRGLLLEEYDELPDQPLDALNKIVESRLDDSKLWPSMDSADRWAGTWKSIVFHLSIDHPDELPCNLFVDNRYEAYCGAQAPRDAKTEWRSLAQNYAMVADWLAEHLQAGGPPTANPGESEGGGKKARTRQPRKRKRKVDPKTAKKREERKAQREKEETLFAEWYGETWVSGYQDYVDWKNANLPEGWSKLTRYHVERAIDNVNKRNRYRKK